MIMKKNKIKVRVYLAMRFDTVLFDLDMTLVDTSRLLDLRKQRRWNDVYANLSNTIIFDDIDGILKKLKEKYKIGVVTSSPGKYAKKVIDHHELDIPILCAYHATRKHKPSPEPLLFALTKINSTPSKAIYIGDEINDIIASKKAGLSSGAVIWGMDHKENIISAKPNIVFTEVS